MPEGQAIWLPAAVKRCCVGHERPALLFAILAVPLPLVVNIRLFRLPLNEPVTNLYFGATKRLCRQVPLTSMALRLRISCLA